MKNIFRFLSFAFIAAIVLAGCKRNIEQIVYEQGTAPVLTSSSTAAMVLNKNNKDQVALTFTWTNPDYRFTTGISSQNVTYTLQFDTAGVNFTSPGKQERAIANDLSVTLTVGELNSFLSKMELKDGKAYNMEIRIRATLINQSLPLYSNVIKINITPYLDFAVEPPGTLAGNYDNGNLWVTGSCFPGPDWANPLAAPQDVTNKFTKIDKLHYELIITFDNTGGYKLIQEQGNWATQYHSLTANAPLGGDIEKKDADPQFASPGSGKYKIEVNFVTGKYKLTPQP